MINKKGTCAVGDCEKEQEMSVSFQGPTPNRLETLHFCAEHGMKFVELGNKAKENATKVQKIISESDKSMVRINTWPELMRKLKPEFLITATLGLELTKGLCVECGNPAFGIREILTPVCGECYGFPRNVLRCALK